MENEILLYQQSATLNSVIVTNVTLNSATSKPAKSNSATQV